MALNTTNRSVIPFASTLLMAFAMVALLSVVTACSSPPTANKLAVASADSIQAVSNTVHRGLIHQWVTPQQAMVYTDELESLLELTDAAESALDGCPAAPDSDACEAEHSGTLRRVQVALDRLSVELLRLSAEEAQAGGDTEDPITDTTEIE